MGFGIGINTEKTDAGLIRGKQEVVAYDCWFTSTGKTIPRFIKYQDQEGFIHSIHDIQVISNQKKNYCGIPMIEYECTCQEDGKEYYFRLLFQIQECLWKIIWRA